MKTMREKIMVAVAIVIILSYVGYQFGYVKLNEKRISLEDELFSLGNYHDNVESLQSQEADTQSQLDSIDKSIEFVKSSKGPYTINTQDFLLFMSTKTKELGIDIIKFKEVGIQENSGVWKIGFDLELNGFLKDLTKLSESIDNLGVTYDVTSMSIRVEGEPEYLNREYKGENKLEWFGEKTQEVSTNETDTTVTIETVETSPVVITPNPVESQSEEVVPDNIQDQLEIMLGIKPKTVTKPVTKPTTTQPGSKTTTTTSETKTNKQILETFSTSRINMDFTIVFTMFNNPKDNFMNKDLYVSSSEGEKIFIIDTEGSTLTISEINKTISEDSDFLLVETNRVMEDIQKLSDGNKDNSGLKEYLNYLMSRR